MSGNQIQLAEFIKNLGNDQLFQVMQQPPQGVPMYLIMSEAQRRQEIMQKAMGQAQPPTSTVADDLRSGIAGTPQMSQGGLPPNDPAAQQGLGSFAAPPPPPMQQGMAPQGQMPQQGMPPEGQQPVGFSEGGGVLDKLKGFVNRFSIYNGMPEEERNRSEAVRAKMRKSREEDSFIPEGVKQALGIDALLKDGAGIGDHLTRGLVSDDHGVIEGAKELFKRNPHVPASIPEHRKADIPGAEEAAEMGLDLNKLLEAAIAEEAEKESKRSGSIKRPSLATNPYSPQKSGLGSFEYAMPDFSNLSMPDMPDEVNDEEYVSKVNEMFPSSVYDQHMGRVDEKLGSIDQDHRNAGSDALMKAGLAMMGGESPHGSVNIARGAGQGFDHLLESREKIRERQEKLEERKELLQLAKIEFERGNVEMAYKMADRARQIEDDIYSKSMDRFTTQYDMAEKDASHKNAATEWQYNQAKDRRDFDQEERHFATNAGLNAQRVAAYGSGGGRSGAWTPKTALSEYRQVFNNMKREVAESPQG
jgi:hypothetical protein